MSELKKPISLPCPRFLGGAIMVEPSDAVTIDATRICNTTASGIHFDNAPQLWDNLVQSGDWKVHVLADEFDLLVDAYRQLEDVVNQLDFQHYVTLRDGSLTIDTKREALRVTVSLRAFVGIQCIESTTTMTAAEYLYDWRRLIHRLSEAS